jgi:KaiC/GvpD/RAD55 family RecA-like ATPase
MSAAVLLAVVWDALADVLGTAAVAAILRRAASRAASRSPGVTFNMNMEVPDLLGSAQLSGYGISFAADNVIQLKYVEVKGCLEHAISVLKARGVRHATDVRRLSIATGRIEVEPAFEGLRGVLTGLPMSAARGDA